MKKLLLLLAFLAPVLVMGQKITELTTSTSAGASDLIIMAENGEDTLMHITKANFLSDYVAVSDTSSMLTVYMLKTDTAAMLLPYILESEVSSTYAPIADPIFTGDMTISDQNVIFVPADGDIQTYVTAADAGSTLILGSGNYTITSTITIDKELNIIGRGRSGFTTTPITTTQGTLINSTTASVTAFQINSDNVRISDLSINMTGAGSKGVEVTNNFVGIVLNDLDIIVNSSGALVGVDVLGSDMVIRDVTFYITSSDDIAAGVFARNNSSTTQDMEVDIF